MSLSVFNSQRGTDFHLARVASDANQALEFSNTSREFRVGVDALPHDGSDLRVSFDVPANLRKKMLLTEYEKQKTALVASVALPVAEEHASARMGSGYGGSPSRRADGVTEAHLVMPAGTLLQLRFADAITVAQVVAGKLFPATVVTGRGAPLLAPHGRTLADGTMVYVRVTPGNGSQYLVQADHAVVRGVNVALNTTAQPRVPIRSAARSGAVPVKVWGDGRSPAVAQAAGMMVLVPEATVLQFFTRSDAILDGVVP